MPDSYVIALCVVALCATAAFFYRAAVLIIYPYELDYGEGIVLWQAQHVTHLSTAYASIQHYPYIVFHYTPLYHLVSVAMSKFTGDLLIAGRLVSAISCLGICLTLAWIVYSTAPKSASRVAVIGGAVLAGAFPCGLIAMRWVPVMRVDMLGLCFTFAGLAVFVLARTSAQRYCAFVLFVAAMYTRQTLVSGVVACLLVAFVMNRREAIKFFAFTTLLGSVTMAALWFATRGEVIKHLFVYNINRFSIRLSFILLAKNLFHPLMIPFLALAAAAAFGSIRATARAISRRNLAPLRASLSTSPYHLALFTFTVHCVLAGLTSLTVGKSGSNVNYFLEFNLSVFVLASLFIARLLWRRRPKRAFFKIALAYLLPIVLVACLTLRVSALVYHLRSMGTRQAEDSEALMRILSRSPEPVMSEDMTLLYKTGKQLPFEPAIVRELAATHIWDETPLVNLISNRRFSVMIISKDYMIERYSPAVLRAIRDNYKPTETHGIFTVYVPSANATPRAQ